MFKDAWMWAKGHPTEAVIAASVLLGTVLALALFLPNILVVAVGAGVLIWANHTPPVAPPVDHGNEAFYRMLSDIFRAYGDELNVLPPATPELLVPNWPGFFCKGGLEVIRAEVEKRRGASLSPEQFKKRLQKAIHSELVSGRVVGVPVLAADGHNPIFWIIDVVESDTAYIVDGVYLNTKEQIAATTAILNARKRLHHERLNPSSGGAPADDEF